MKRTRHLRLPTYQVGDTVWLNNKHLKLNVPNRKLYQKRDGPFKITHKISPVNYRLQLPPQWKIHDVFHSSLLIPHKETPLYGPQFTRPPPELDQNEDTYEVEAILNHKERRRTMYYLIKWKGYPQSENTWEPEENLQKSKRLLVRYKRSKNLP
ncbi:Histone-lysine N-methyltransferase SUV39H1 [Leucoagaricus sp. SymC.cos]|nr:Histone-lysine N-methyltransferase SUV39H1 [Leucoagaricus sp. SymC.cos]